MAHWNYKDKQVHYASAVKRKKGWWEIDCDCPFCYGGLEWFGDEPEECKRCGGTGKICWHEKSKTFAQYPGGSLLGRGELTELERKGKENKMAQIHMDFSPVKNCKSPEDTYGEICVKCNKCGRWNVKCFICKKVIEPKTICGAVEFFDDFCAFFCIEHEPLFEGFPKCKTYKEKWDIPMSKKKFLGIIKAKK